MKYADLIRFEPIESVIQLREADEATARWTELVRAEPVAKRAPIAYRRAWGKLDKEAGLGTGEDSDPVHSPAG